MSTKGTLTLTILDAALTLDVSQPGDAQMDPYVVLTSRALRSRTSTKENAHQAPVWNEAFDLEISNISEEVHLRVMDENVTSNKMIGECTIKLACMCVNGGLQSEWSLANGSKQAGVIRVQGAWAPAGSDPVATSSQTMPS